MSSELARTILTECWAVYRELAGGFFESTYRRALQFALSDRGLSSESEVTTDVVFRGRIAGRYRLDLVVENAVIVECKVAQRLDPAHQAQLIGYLKATRYEHGVLFNFGDKPGFKKLIHENGRRLDVDDAG